MGNEPLLEFSGYAAHRMHARGITEAHVWFCVMKHTSEYKVGENEIVYQCQLPDGRNIKVRVRDGSKNPIYVIDAFSFR